MIIKNCSAIYIFLALITSCSSKFIVLSDPPQADVFVVDAKTGERKTIGKTPIEMPVEDVKKTVVNQPTAGEFYSILVEKPGFETQTFNVPSGQFSTLITSLDVKLKEGKSQAEFRLAKEILDNIFLAQRFANLSQFERAHIELDKVINQFPTFSRALSMRASVFFAQKNYQESLKWYEQALVYDPNLEEAVKMTAKVRSLWNLPPGGINAGLGTPQRSVSSTATPQSSEKKTQENK
jgi:tetratricopeptide (TPR) repeat protein